MIIRGKQQQNYSVIPNAIADNSELTFEERGLLIYLLAKPGDWTVQITDLCRQGGIGRDKAYQIINRLLEFGYMRRQQRRLRSGKLAGVDYVVFSEPNMQGPPLPENQHVVSPRPGLPDTANQDV